MLLSADSRNYLSENTRHTKDGIIFSCENSMIIHNDLQYHITFLLDCIFENVMDFTKEVRSRYGPFNYEASIALGKNKIAFISPYNVFGIYYLNKRRLHRLLIDTNSLSVGARGFEPPLSCTPCKRVTGLRHAPNVQDYSLFSDLTMEFTNPHAKNVGTKRFGMLFPGALVNCVICLALPPQQGFQVCMDHFPLGAI